MVHKDGRFFFRLAVPNLLLWLGRIPIAKHIHRLDRRDSMTDDALLARVQSAATGRSLLGHDDLAAVKKASSKARA